MFLLFHSWYTVSVLLQFQGESFILGQVECKFKTLSCPFLSYDNRAFLNHASKHNFQHHYWKDRSWTSLLQNCERIKFVVCVTQFGVFCYGSPVKPILFYRRPSEGSPRLTWEDVMKESQSCLSSTSKEDSLHPSTEDQGLSCVTKSVPKTQL